MNWALAALAIVLLPALAAAQDSTRTYTDSRGKKIVFPFGAISFADQVVSFQLGNPAPHVLRRQDSTAVLGAPDYNPRRPASGLTLGCAGVLVARFDDNALVDVPGPDLYVFEVGPQVEALGLAISQDGTTWIEAGRIAGGTAEVDIAAIAKPGERYRFVRLTDLKSGCRSQYPGADVDAIGAIGSAFQIAFDAAVLFEFDRSELRPAAEAALTDAAAKLAALTGAIVIDGHTDSVGAAAYNRKLSQARAESARAFFAQRPELKGRTMTAQGFGAARPIAPNANETGRQQNRRVEVVVAPAP